MFAQSARTLMPQLRMALAQSVRHKSAEAAPAPVRVEKTVNNVTVLGRVGADPQLRGSVEHPVVMFSVATHTNYRYENGDWAQRTDWHRIVVFKPNLRETISRAIKRLAPAL